MRFKIDENLSPSLAALFVAADRIRIHD